MMGCTRRVTGTNLAVDELLRVCSLKPYRIDRKGQPGQLKTSPPHAHSGVHFSVSDREFNDLAGQVADAIVFLEGNEAVIRCLTGIPGVNRPSLDFGIAWRDVYAQVDRFPARLLQLAGNLGLDLELSHYPVAEPETSATAGA